MTTTRPRHDVVVVGARCRRGRPPRCCWPGPGHDVVVVDRATLPERHPVHPRDRPERRRPAAALGPARRGAGRAAHRRSARSAFHGPTARSSGHTVKDTVRRRLPGRAPAPRPRRDRWPTPPSRAGADRGLRRHGHRRSGATPPAGPSASPGATATARPLDDRRPRRRRRRRPAVPGRPGRRGRTGHRAARARAAPTHYAYVAGLDWRRHRVPPRRPARSPGSSPPTTARPACGCAPPPARRRRRRRRRRLAGRAPSTPCVARTAPVAGRAGCGRAPHLARSDRLLRLPNQARRARPAPAGRWSATPATTATRSPATASPTPSATPTCWPPRSTRACGAVPPRGRRLAGYGRERDAARRARSSTLTCAIGGFPPVDEFDRPHAPARAAPSTSRPADPRRPPGPRRAGPRLSRLILRATDHRKGQRHDDHRQQRGAPQRRRHRDPVRHARRGEAGAGGRPVPVPGPQRVGHRHPQPRHDRRLLRRRRGAVPRARRSRSTPTTRPCSSGGTTARPRSSTCCTRWPPA